MTVQHQPAGHERRAAEGLRFRLLMVAVGFLGGLALVVPAVLWLTAGQNPKHVANLQGPKAFSGPAMTGDLGAAPPSLVSVPTRTGLPVVAPRPDPAPSNVERIRSATGDTAIILSARAMIRAGDLTGARRLLSVPDLATHGEALFMLAETYDPTVLAALGTAGLIAEAQTARRYYEAALAQGMTAAERRLEQLR